MLLLRLRTNNGTPTSLLLQLILVACCAVVCSARKHPAVKMFIVAGEANVEGFASVSHLKQLAMAEPTAYKHVWNGTDFVVRDDVFVSYDHYHSKDWIHGPLSPRGGFAGDAASFGPELQLGHVLGNMYNEPVVIVKAGWKGRNLALDFASPSTNHTGFQWYRMIKHIDHTANNLHEILGPEYKYSRPDIGGFVWWQGYTDLQNADMANDYGDNLELFIKDVRSALKLPLLPVVVAELGGQGIGSPDPQELLFRQAQEQVVAQRFLNLTTKFVPTAGYVKPDEPAIKDDYRLYYGNAETMLEISQALAMALASMDFKKQKALQWAWFSKEADITMEKYETRTELHFAKLVAIAFAGVFLFVAIVCFGGSMSRTWNVAMDRFRPSNKYEEGVSDEDEMEMAMSAVQA